MTKDRQSYICSNPECKQSFDSPKLIQFYACPSCSTEIKEAEKSGCQYYLGYLAEREKGKPIPIECITCEKSIECMLETIKASENAVKHIEKWYR